MELTCPICKQPISSNTLYDCYTETCPKCYNRCNLSRQHNQDIDLFCNNCDSIINPEDNCHVYIT